MKILLLEPIYFFQRWPLEIYGTRRYFYSTPLSLLQLAAYYPKQTRVIDGMNETSLTPKKLAKILQEYNSEEDIIGIASHSNVGSINAIYTLKLAKLYAPRATVLIGGYHATFFHRTWIKIGADIVIRNEGEVSFQIICDKIKTKGSISPADLSGTTYSNEWQKKINKYDNNPLSEKQQSVEIHQWRKIFEIPTLMKNREFVVAPDRPLLSNLDTLPLPKRLKGDISKNFIPFQKDGYMTTLESARGCPFNCEFCSTRKMWGGIQRYKSAKRLIEEIKDCLHHNIKNIYFIDESWGVNVKRDWEFLNEIEKQNLKFLWGIQIRPDTIIKNPDLIKKAGSLGCRMALIGYETIYQDLLENCNKGTKVKDFVKIRNILREANILNFGYFLIGLPGETAEMRSKLFATLERLTDMSLIQQFIPYFSGTFASKQNNGVNKEAKVQNPIFMLDTFYTARLLNLKQINSDIVSINNQLRKYFFNYYFDIKKFFHLIYGKGEIGRVKRNIYRTMYLSLIKNLFNFRPQHLINFLRGL